MINDILVFGFKKNHILLISIPPFFFQECKNEIPKCPDPDKCCEKYKNKGYCKEGHKYSAWTRKHCPKACRKECVDKTTTTTTTTITTTTTTTMPTKPPTKPTKPTKPPTMPPTMPPTKPPTKPPTMPPMKPTEPPMKLTKPPMKPTKPPISKQNLNFKIKLVARVKLDFNSQFQIGLHQINQDQNTQDNSATKICSSITLIFYCFDADFLMNCHLLM